MKVQSKKGLRAGYGFDTGETPIQTRRGDVLELQALDGSWYGRVIGQSEGIITVDRWTKRPRRGYLLHWAYWKRILRGWYRALVRE